jgi:hypothetical protein
MRRGLLIIEAHISAYVLSVIKHCIIEAFVDLDSLRVITYTALFWYATKHIICDNKNCYNASRVSSIDVVFLVSLVWCVLGFCSNSSCKDLLV